MIVIDISWPIMLKMMVGNKTARFFYLNREKAIEIFTTMNSMLFRFIYKKLGETEDALFYETYLKDSVPILAISYVNEDEWRDAFNNLAEKINQIELLINEKKEE